MLWFILAAAVLLLAALGIMLRPFLTRDAAAGEGLRDSDIYRRQAQEIDADLASGTLTPEEAGIARTEIMRRLLAASDREAGETGPKPAGSPRFILVSLVGLVSLATIGVYLMAGRPDSIGGKAETQAEAGTSGPSQAADGMAQAVAMLQDRLKKDPKSVEGWILLGRSMVSLQRFGEAEDAFRKAIALTPDDKGLHAQLGEILTIRAGDMVTPEALIQFNKAGDDPRARYYLALAAAQRGDKKSAAGQLQALLAAAPPGAPWRPLVAQRLAELQGTAPPGEQAQGGPPAETPAPAGTGPSQADMAAAAQMPPEARLAMIQSMVARLAQRMEQNPNDKTGWERLARAYEVLGESDKAAAARAHAAAIKPEDDRPSAEPAAAGP